MNMTNDDISIGDLDMITYWFRKYCEQKNKTGRKEILKAATSFLDGDALMKLYDDCIAWHSDIMDRSIFKPG